MSIKVLVADDHRIVREGLCGLLRSLPDIEVVAEADNGESAVELTRELSPDIVIMDVIMPGMNGIEATSQITQYTETTKVIALSMFTDRRFVVGMLKAGAKGYLIKDCDFEELTNAIRMVKENNTYLSPSVVDIVVKEYIQVTGEDDDSLISKLSNREREVLQHLVDGKTIKEIAILLNLSIKTIETYRQQITQKLDIHNIADLTKFAIREGLTTV